MYRETTHITSRLTSCPAWPSLIGRFRPPSEVPSVPHGVLDLSAELGDDSVLVGVNSRPQQSVSLLQQPAQVFVGALVAARGGGGATRGGGGVGPVLLLL